MKWFTGATSEVRDLTGWALAQEDFSNQLDVSISNILINTSLANAALRYLGALSSELQAFQRIQNISSELQAFQRIQNISKKDAASPAPTVRTGRTNLIDYAEVEESHATFKSNFAVGYWLGALSNTPSGVYSDVDGDICVPGVIVPLVQLFCPLTFHSILVGLTIVGCWWCGRFPFKRTDSSDALDLLLDEEDLENAPGTAVLPLWRHTVCAPPNGVYTDYIRLDVVGVNFHADHML